MKQQNNEDAGNRKAGAVIHNGHMRGFWHVRRGQWDESGIAKTDKALKLEVRAWKAFQLASWPVFTVRSA